MATTRPEARPAPLSRGPRAGLALRLVVFALAGTAGAQNQTDMMNTKHNLAVSGPGPIRAVTETRICVFCHTPHNATPLTPLWNRELRPQNYDVYTSPTLKAGPLPQPSGPTKLCLSCHDGTIAMGAVLNPVGGITMKGSDLLPSDSLANFGLDLSGHHPVSFSYQLALPNPELAPTPPSDLVFGGADELHCTTCHDPHNDSFGKFLLKDNRYSMLCTTCHQMTGWVGSEHQKSTASVVGILPRPPKTWPTYTKLNEWGCEVCHTPHFAPTAVELLNFTDLPPDQFSCTSPGCHSSQPGPPHPLSAASTAQGLADAAARLRKGVDIALQASKPSAHHAPGTGTPMPRRARGGVSATGRRSVTCQDCHNPHLVNEATAEAPYASGMLAGVGGVDRNGSEVRPAVNQYEVCFKCHADDTPDISYVPRVLEVTNLRLAFAPENPSYHAVVAPAKNLNVPSIPSAFEPTMTPSTQMYCTACHADDEGGSEGPHGSAFAPILKERYETTDNTGESYENYALCYRCHERSNILTDASFRKKTLRKTASGGGHSGHLAAGAPCSACHDAHGVSETAVPGQATGSHTHLINFSTQIVLPRPGSTYPVFKDDGTFAGSCTLVCHGVTHDNLAYP